MQFGVYRNEQLIYFYFIIGVYLIILKSEN